MPTTPDVVSVLRPPNRLQLFARGAGAVDRVFDQKVSADSKEIALLLLLIFALIAAGYVMKTGLKRRSYHTRALSCVIIITSVVPRQPLQMAMAVNQALMSLNKSGIFCTEPYRKILRVRSRTACSTRQGLSQQTPSCRWCDQRWRRPVCRRPRDVKESRASRAEREDGVVIGKSEPTPSLLNRVDDNASPWPETLIHGRPARKGDSPRRS